MKFSQALEVVNNNNSFRMKTIKTQGGDVYAHTFNYGIASYSDFMTPLGAGSRNALQMRGITFVEDCCGIRKYPALRKFFNINENPLTEYKKLKDEPIMRITEKMDGSMIHFYRLHNDVIPKTQFDFDNEQINMVKKILKDNTGLSYVISECMNADLYPIFELVSPFNRIVLDYDVTELVLIDVVNSDCVPVSNGSFDIVRRKLKKWIRSATKYNIKEYTLSDLIEMAGTTENAEGWVVTFRNGNQVKVKTQWYLDRHKVYSECNSSVKYIVDAVINGFIDDVKSMITSTELRKHVIEIESKVIEKYNNIVNEVQKYYDIFKTMERREFAIKYKDVDYAYIVFKIKDENQLTDVVKEFIIKSTNKEEKARRFIGVYDE